MIDIKERSEIEKICARCIYNSDADAIKCLSCIVCSKDGVPQGLPSNFEPKPETNADHNGKGAKMRRIKFEIVVTEGATLNKPHPFEEDKPYEPIIASLVGITWSFEDRVYGDHIRIDKPTLTEGEIAQAGKELILSALEAASESGIKMEVHGQWKRIPGTNQVVREGEA